MDFDVLVVANPVWEISRLVDRIPFAGSGAVERGAGGASPGAETDEPTVFAVVEDGGGSALNAACALAAAGRRVLAVGRVGADPEGFAAVDALRRRGVETRIDLVAGRRTKLNHLFVERRSGGTAFQVIVPSLAVPPWEEEPFGLATIRWLLLDRLAVAAPGWLRARRAKAGCRNALMRNSALATPGTAERFRLTLGLLDYLQIPEDSGLTPGTAGHDPIAAGQVLPPGNQGSEIQDRGRLHRPAALAPMSGGQLREIRAAGVGIVVRTRGADGAILQVNEDPHAERAAAAAPAIHIPAVPTEVLDPTGAGDAFAAGCLDGMLARLAIAEAAGRGADWAARACRHLGARGWLDHEPPAPAVRSTV